MTIAGIEQLEQVERLASDMLRRISPGERRRILRGLARVLQRGQRDRIAAQRNADGTPYEPRREKKADAAPSYPLVFLYPAGAAEPKLVILRDWQRQGDRVTGFDAESRREKSYTWDKIDRFLPPERAAGAPAGRLRRKGSVRRKAMFRKLRTGSYLRTGVTADEAWVGFTGRAAAIARVHQEGLADAPKPRGRKIRYPRRDLLGVTEADRQLLLGALFTKVAGPLR